MTTRTKNERRYDMGNEQMNKHVLPAFFAILMAMVGALFTIAYLGGQQVSNSENTDNNVKEIKKDVKEISNKYSSLENKVNGMDYKIDNFTNRSYEWYKSKENHKR